MDRRSSLRAIGGVFASTIAGATSVPGRAAAHSSGPADTHLRIEDFGGRPDDRSFDNSPALSRALRRAAQTGQAVHYGVGTYHHHKPVLHVNSETGRADGPSVTGSGRERTQLRFSGDGLFEIRGIGAQGEAKRPGGRFFYGGGFTHLTIDGRDAQFGSGLTIVGWWDAVFDTVRFQNIPGNAVEYRHDRAFDPNPDWSASGRNHFARTEFHDCGGWGIRTAPIASHSLLVDNCLFGFCLAGGIFLAAPNSRIVGSAFLRIGWRRIPGRESAYRPSAVAVVIGNEIGGSQLGRFEVSLCEFDSASGAYCVIQNARIVRIIANRFLFQPLDPENKRLLPRYGVSLAPQNVDVAAAAVKVEQIEYRVDGDGSHRQPILFHLGHGANVRDVKIEPPVGPAGRTTQFGGEWSRYIRKNGYDLPIDADIGTDG